MAYIYDLTDTWSAAGTVFNGIKLNVTNTASAAASKLITLQIGGTEHFSVTKAGVGYFSGNVGIGTASPSFKLDVQGNSSSTATVARVYNGDTSASSNAVYNCATGQGVSAEWYSYSSANWFGTKTNHPQIFITNNTERARIDSSGNVGIGTSSPVRPLHVFYNSTVVGAYSAVFQGAVGGYGAGVSFQSVLTGGALAEMARITADGESSWNTTVGTQDAGLRFYTALDGTVAEKMRIDASGNVGIGTSSPANQLDVVGIASARSDISTGNSPLVAINTNTGSNTTKYTSLLFQGYDTIGTNKNVGLVVSGPSDANYVTSYMAFQTRSGDALSERMRIDSSGNLLVGTTSSGYGGRFVVIKNGGDVVYAAQTASGGYCYKSNAANNGGNYYHMEFQENGTARGSISSNGSVVLYNTTSDVRLKDNIENADDASSLIDAIQVRKYDWKADGTHQRYGFIAQELIEVAPEAVSQPEDPDGMMAVDYSKLVPMLVKELQSVRARLAQLEGN